MGLGFLFRCPCAESVTGVEERVALLGLIRQLPDWVEGAALGFGITKNNIQDLIFTIRAVGEGLASSRGRG